MTSRERIVAAINHRPVDRVPVDCGGTRQTGISVFAYAQLRDQLRLAPSPPKAFDVYQMLAEIEPAVAHRLGADCVGLQRRSVAFGIVNEDYKPWTLHDGTRVLVPGGFDPQREADGSLVLVRDGEVIARMPRGGWYFDRVEKYPGALHPDLDAWEPPRLSEEDVAHYARESERLYAETDKAIILPLGPPYELFYGIGQGGFEDWMITFATEDAYVQWLYEKLVDTWIANLAAVHEAVGQQVQILQIADDFGTQQAPFLSTEMFRQKVMPAYQRGIEWVHSQTSWKVMLHSDGAIYPLIPSIIEMGVDILNPVQTSAAGMEARRLKRQFGRDLVFWGAACDSQHTLPDGTPKQVADEVRANLDAFMPDSGHVLASVHNIQANVPPRNILAMYDAAAQYGAAVSGDRP